MLTAFIPICATKQLLIMFTHKDIEYRTIFVVNCIKERNLKMSNGELMMFEVKDGVKKTLTKLPFQKILALFIVGDITITTPLLDKCKKYNVTLVVMRQNLRPVFYWSNSAEANYLLRKKQFAFNKDDISIAKLIISNKIYNQKLLLIKTRKKDKQTCSAIINCDAALNQLNTIDTYQQLLGMEGYVAKSFFNAYYQDYEWNSRMPRTKIDIINTTLDIGYSILFNYIECFVRMFGFDLYVGIYHRLWFKRKSLICDLMEPFRCIIDHSTLLALNRGQFTKEDFVHNREEYHLKYDRISKYYKVFFDALIPRKTEIFKYVQSYYRSFMQEKSSNQIPTFIF